MNLLKSIGIGVILNGLALYGLIYFLPNEVVYTGGFTFFILAGFVLGILNVFLKPIIKFISLPFVFLSGGLFLIVINAFILWVLQYILKVVQFRDVTLDFPNIGSYVISALVLGLLNWGLHLIIKNKGK